MSATLENAFERDTPAIGSQDRSPVEARAAIRSLKTLHTKACVSWTHSYSTDGEWHNRGKTCVSELFRLCSKNVIKTSQFETKTDTKTKHSDICTALWYWKQEGQLTPTVRASALGSLCCLHMHDCATFLRPRRPVIILTSDSDSATPISNKSVATVVLR